MAYDDIESFKQRVRDTLRLRERHNLQRLPAALPTMRRLRRICEQRGILHDFDRVLR